MNTTMTITPAAALLALAAWSKTGPAGNATSTTNATNPTTAPAAPAGEPVVPGAPGKTDAPAGTYDLDPAHSTVVFRLSHLGFSKYTAAFSKLGGQLRFDPAHPEAMQVEVAIDPRSLSLPTPPAGF